jgi:hypothetical protein
MESMRRFIWILVFAGCFFLLSLPVADAYVDPGTGSYVFQLLVGALLGAAVALKVFWRRIWSFLTRRTARSATADPRAPDSSMPTKPRD